MNLLTLFELFLLALSFYSIASFTGISKYTVPLACLFCIFWVQRLEKRMKEEEEARKKLLQFRLEKHHAKQEQQGIRKVHQPSLDAEE